MNNELPDDIELLKATARAQRKSVISLKIRSDRQKNDCRNWKTG